MMRRCQPYLFLLLIGLVTLPPALPAARAEEAPAADSISTAPAASGSDSAIGEAQPTDSTLQSSAETPAGFDDAMMKRLPPGALSVTVVHDVPALMKVFDATPFGAVYNDPGFRTFLGPLIQLLELRNRELGSSMRGQGSAPFELQGGLVLAQYPPENSRRDEPALVTIYDAPGGDAPAMLELILASRQVPGARIQRATDPVGGHAIVALQSVHTIEERIEVKGKAKKYKRDLYKQRGLSEGDLEPAPLATRREITEELFYAGSDCVVQCTGGRALLEQVLNRLDRPGEGDSMAGEKKWIEPRRALRSSPPIEFYRDLRPSRGRRGSGDDDLKFGLNEVRSLVAGTNFLPDRLGLEISVYIPEPRLGLGGLLFINEPLNRPQYETRGFIPMSGLQRDAAWLVPADAVAYSAFSGDLQKLWSEAFRILQSGAPDIAQLLDIYFNTQVGPSGQSAFASRFASTFGSRWITFTRYPDEHRRQGDQPEMTVMMELKDSAALSPVLDAWVDNLSTLLNLQIEKYEVSGRRYFRLQGAEGLDPRLTPLGPLAYICLDPHWLIFSTRQDHILAALARLQSRSPAGAESAAKDAPLFHDPDYLALREELPGDRFFEAYTSPDALDAMMGSPLMLLLSRVLKDSVNSLVELEETPREDVWQRRFGGTGFSLRTSGPALVADLAFRYAQPSGSAAP